MPLPEWERLFELSDRHGFVIASDECYSEIYFRDEPPLGGLEAAHRLGRDFRRLVALTSLSKRSNVPGMRSGFVAGDAQILKAFLLYRTYHGSAMSPVVQAASLAAWSDEQHVVANRDLVVSQLLRPQRWTLPLAIAVPIFYFSNQNQLSVIAIASMVREVFAGAMAPGSTTSAGMPQAAANRRHKMSGAAPGGGHTTRCTRSGDSSPDQPKPNEHSAPSAAIAISTIRRP